jgi:putative acetyltransferase
MSVILRNIEIKDNKALAKIVRNAFIEFNVPQEGTIFTEPETDNLYQLFQFAGSTCFVAEEDGIVLGCCGIFPTDGLPDGCAELVKFYLSTAARGKGIGRLLMETCFDAAAKIGYTQLYLESFPELSKAVSMYEKAGFNMLQEQLGNSGHFATTIWMLKDLVH